MLQLSFIRQNPELVKERLAIKNFTGTDIVDDIIAADDEKRRLQLESENMQSKANAISKDIGKLMAAKQTDECGDLVDTFGGTNRPPRVKHGPLCCP